MQKKNLIVFHLESLSNEILEEFKDVLGFIRNIHERSERYNNYISSATSTVMVTSTFFSGSSNCLDHLNSFSPESNVCPENHLVDIACEAGYSCTRLTYPSIPPKDKERLAKWGVWTEKHGDCLYYEDEQAFLSSIKDYCNRDSPWLLNIFPDISNIAYCDFNTEEKITDIKGRLSHGYATLDRIVRDVYCYLETTKLLENTLLVFYGDHGDDLFTHSFNSGMCHGTDPYYEMVHCPFFLFDVSANKENIDRYELITTEDCKNIIFSKLGMVTTTYQHDYVFSQNLFANQAQSLVMCKSFMVFDGEYILLVSRFGLEMYDCRIDASNHNNLLSFFTLTNDGTLNINNVLFSRAYPHFNKCYTELYLQEIQNRFRKLQPALIDWVDNKYSLIVNKKNCFNKKYFFKIRKRIYYWKYSLSIFTYIRVIKEMGCKTFWLKLRKRTLVLIGHK